MKMKTRLIVAPVVLATSAVCGLLAASGQEMKTNSSVVANGGGIVKPTSSSVQQSREDEKHNKWLFKNLQEIQKVRVGTTRKEVDKLFTLPGGVQPLNPLMLVNRKSPYIFVRVNYKTQHDAQGRVKRSPNDKVLSISEPYLQHWTIRN